MDRPRTGVTVWLIAALVAGCGGRDPLLGDVDPGPDAAPRTGVADAGAGARRDGPTTNVPPVVNPTPGPDAGGGFMPPLPPMVRDAGVATPPGVACALPACLEKLKATCLPSGTCTQQGVRVGQNAINNICYSNGVRFVAMLGSGRAPVITRVTRPDGSLCYSRDTEMRGAGVNAINYRGPMGELVATATIDQRGLTVTCPGLPPQFIPSACEPGVRIGDAMCAAGACM